jgi:hypothetical protein
MTDSSPVDRAIINAVRALLKLASRSLGRFTISQLHALSSDLRRTMAVVNGQIQAEESSAFAKNVLKRLVTHSCFTDGGRVLLDMSDWDDESDEEKEAEEKGTDGMGGKYPLLPDFVAACSRGSQVARAENRLPVRWQLHGVSTWILTLPPLVTIPGPYPMDTPEIDKLPDFWYVVGCGREVRIFIDE